MVKSVFKSKQNLQLGLFSNYAISFVWLIKTKQLLFSLGKTYLKHNKNMDLPIKIREFFLFNPMIRKSDVD